ncbi:hypothetical protein [Citrobacter koseri]|uniref:hypothetical protein n=1 Tax=Citrobacter koseri TaxID=545 RepID=UPI0028BE9E88|nr:hypothetical protein [Citrobacter koseri]MDT7487284.1 hypothetical protein [Citrobacter koseri]
MSLKDILHGEFSLNSRYIFSFMNGKGDVLINGIITNKGVKYVVNRQISFNYQTTRNHYLMKNTNIELFGADMGDKGGVIYHLPDFFTKKGGELALNISKDFFENPVFIVSGTPLFFVKKPRIFSNE